MRTLFLLLALAGTAHATPYRIMFAGTVDISATSGAPIAFGETYSATIFVDPSTPDAAPDDPVLGRYFHPVASSSILFSGGFSLTDQPFEYRVVDSAFSPVIDTTLDALILDFSTPTMVFVFALRFTPDTWTGDAALTPLVVPLSPDPVGGIIPAQFSFLAGSHFVNGTIAEFSIDEATLTPVPETPAVAALLASTLSGFVFLTTRFRTARKLPETAAAQLRIATRRTLRKSP